VRRTEEAIWRLYDRAMEILDGRRRGLGLPILRALAARGFGPALNVLSSHVAPARALPLLRRAARLGDAQARYNLAIERLNRGDLRGYRRALASAARGDAEARAELRAFRVRFTHTDMRRWRMWAAERRRPRRTPPAA
jgi:hypothetical protein